MKTPTTEGQLSLMRDARRVRKGGAPVLADRQRVRLDQMVAWARERSAFYRKLYRALPDRRDDVTALPVTSKTQLMEHFHDVVTGQRACAG